MARHATPQIMASMLAGGFIMWLAMHMTASPSLERRVLLSAAFQNRAPAACVGKDARAMAAKMAAYQRDVDVRMRHLRAHQERLSHVDLWDLLAPLWSCDPMERIGDPLDGGKWMCAANVTLSQQPCIVFSMGSNGQTDFEEAILERAPGCAVHTYDHTLSTAKRAAVEAVEGINFHSMGITSKEDLAAMRRDAGNLSPYSPANFTTVLAAMTDAGADWIDVLKMDIEGSEWPVFHELLASNDTLPITQILIEIHLHALPSYARLYPGTAASSVASLFEGMWRHGYQAFANEPNMRADPRTFIEYSFIKTDEAGNTIFRPR